MDVAYEREGESLDFGARILAAVDETQEPAHLFEAESQLPGTANEREAPEVFLAIEPMSAGASRRGGHEADLLVISDGPMLQPVRLERVPRVNGAARGFVIAAMRITS